MVAEHVQDASVSRSHSSRSRGNKGPEEEAPRTSALSTRRRFRGAARSSKFKSAPTRTVSSHSQNSLQSASVKVTDAESHGYANISSNRIKSKHLATKSKKVAHYPASTTLGGSKVKPHQGEGHGDKISSDQTNPALVLSTKNLARPSETPQGKVEVIEGVNSSLQRSTAHDAWSPNEVESVSRLWELSSKEENELFSLGERLRDISHHKNTPRDVIRFMKAHPGSLDAAETMFRNMIQWRLDNNADNILEDYEPPRLIRDYIPGAILVGCDLEGDPIYAERIGSADTPTMAKRFGAEHMIKVCSTGNGSSVVNNSNLHRKPRRRRRYKRASPMLRHSSGFLFSCMGVV